jgi:hypothetical protein
MNLNIIIVKIIASFLLIISLFESCRKQFDINSYVAIPTEGNSWYYHEIDGVKQFINFKNYKWKDENVILRTFFRVEDAGEIHLGVNMNEYEGSALFEAEVANKKYNFTNKKGKNQFISVGKVLLPKPGYYFIDFKGIKKSTDTFPAISFIQIGNEKIKPKLTYITKDFFYWGRRGPSVHLKYEAKEKVKPTEWFYNEVLVSRENDVVGSFYMANGFQHGYFGMQTNSTYEKRILFSVWSPFTTDNPAEIPANQRVELIAKGEGVTTNDFGNEGSGGQSYLKYNWKSGVTYKFLLGAKPEGNNSTTYSAYFYAPELGKWNLIAKWRRPLTDEYLSNYHSFLENFLTETGPIPREVMFSNQWICDVDGNWTELTKAKYTADATARNGARKDYAGGVSTEGNAFYLKNCGFFSENVKYDVFFERNAADKRPQINFKELPVK